MEIILAVMQVEMVEMVETGVKQEMLEMVVHQVMVVMRDGEFVVPIILKLFLLTVVVMQLTVF